MTSWGTHRCPASDEADALLYVSSPFDYEALDEIGDGESFFGECGVDRASLMRGFQEPYQQFLARAGPPIYG
jgi:hypothetical protein